MGGSDGFNSSNRSLTAGEGARCGERVDLLFALVEGHKLLLKSWLLVGIGSGVSRNIRCLDTAAGLTRH